MLLEYFLDKFYSVISKPLDEVAETSRKANSKESKESDKTEEEDPK